MKENITIEEKILSIFKDHLEHEEQKLDVSYIATLVKGKSRKLNKLCLKEQEIIDQSGQSQDEVEFALTNLERQGVLAHTEQVVGFWFVTPLGILLMRRTEKPLVDLAGAILEIARERIEKAISPHTTAMGRRCVQFLVILMLLWGARSRHRAMVWKADETVRIFRQQLEYLLDRISKYIPTLNRSIMGKLEQHARRHEDLRKAFLGLFQFDHKSDKSWFDIEERDSDERLGQVCKVLLDNLPKEHRNSLAQFFENCAYGDEMSSNFGKLLELSGLFGGAHWETEWACKVHTTIKTILNGVGYKQNE